MGRIFKYLNRAWVVEPTGLSHGVGSGIQPGITSWGVSFKPANDQSAKPLYGSIYAPDPGQLSEEDLGKSLEAALVMNALENPDWDWRTVEGISNDTGLPEQKVRQLLVSSSAVLRSRFPDKNGRSLYTTRQRYRRQRTLLDALRGT